MNLRRAPYASRWAEMDEYDFLKAEENILDGQQPPTIGKWKKESSNKMGELDGAYEAQCIKFLDYFIAQKGF